MRDLYDAEKRLVELHVAEEELRQELLNIEAMLAEVQTEAQVLRGRVVALGRRCDKVTHGYRDYAVMITSSTVSVYFLDCGFGVGLPDGEPSEVGEGLAVIDGEAG